MRLSFKEKQASQERSRAFMIGLGLFGAAMFLAFAWIGFTAPNRIPGRSYYYVNVDTKNADNITPHNQVRVDGDIVGQVLNPTVTHVHGQLQGTFEMQLDPSVEPLRSGSTVQVLPRSAVGVRYVEVTPSANGTKIPSGGTIQASQTSATEPLDTALSTFDAPTRTNIQKFLRGFGEGLIGQGQNINDTLGGAPAMLAAAGAGSQPTGSAPAMLQSTSGVLGTLASHHGYTAQLIRGSGVVAATNDPVRETIATGFQPQANALEPFDDTPAVDGTLSQAPPTLIEANNDLPQFDRMATQLTGFAKAVEPALKAGPAAFTQASALFTEARPELVEAKTVLGTVGNAVNPTLGLLNTLSPVLKPSTLALNQADPIVNNLGQHGCDIVDFGKYWTNGMSYADQNGGGNVLRFDVVADVVYGASTPTPGVLDDPYPAPCAAYEGKG